MSKKKKDKSSSEIKLDEQLRVDHSHLKKLQECSHKIGVNGKPSSDENPSEWAFTDAMHHFKHGQVIIAKEFFDQLELSVIEESLNRLVDQGMLSLIFDEKDGEFKYEITAKGKDYVNNL